MENKFTKSRKQGNLRFFWGTPVKMQEFLLDCRALQALQVSHCPQELRIPSSSVVIWRSYCSHEFLQASVPLPTQMSVKELVTELVNKNQVEEMEKRKRPLGEPSSPSMTFIADIICWADGGDIDVAYRCAGQVYFRYWIRSWKQVKIYNLNNDIVTWSNCQNWNLQLTVN